MTILLQQHKNWSYHW